MMKFLLPQGRGRQAEELAGDYLRKRGLKLLAKNFSCRLGEVDLIMLDGECLVFVEVKFRNNANFGHGSEAVDGRKQQRLIHTAQYYLQQHPDLQSQPMRFDVVSIEGERHPDIQWLANAFMAE